MDKNIFKAYDVRGKYPKELNEKIAEKIAGVLAKHFKKGEIVVGHDARLSSPKIYKAVLRAVARENPKIDVVKVGLISTPLLYFLVNRIGATGGIMVTASHNPKEYNGLKVVGKNAEPVSGKEILRLVLRSEGKK